MTVREYVLDALKKFGTVMNDHWALKSELPSEETINTTVAQAVTNKIGELGPLSDEDMAEVFSVIAGEGTGGE